MNYRGSHYLRQEDWGLDTNSYLLLSPLMELFRDNETLIQIEHNLVRNPTSTEAKKLSIYTSVVEDLNMKLPRTIHLVLRGGEGLLRLVL